MRLRLHTIQSRIHLTRNRLAATYILQPGQNVKSNPFSLCKERKLSFPELHKYEMRFRHIMRQSRELRRDIQSGNYTKQCYIEIVQGLQDENARSSWLSNTQYSPKPDEKDHQSQSVFRPS